MNFSPKLDSRPPNLINKNIEEIENKLKVIEEVKEDGFESDHFKLPKNHLDF